jgi:hypothetical protein
MKSNNRYITYESISSSHIEENESYFMEHNKHFNLQIFNTPKKQSMFNHTMHLSDFTD